ncbi:MAG: MTAP family purine nucleoside phosphorylase, partial [Bacteriovoracaceae bacterium]
MGQIKVAIIGGSGIYKLDAIKVKNKLTVETPFGNPSGEILECEVDGNAFYFLPRHGVGHKITPSEVNYRANIFALKKLGVNTIVSISAVGSLKEEFAPRNFVVIDQFIDWTKGGRKRTFFDEGMV